MNNALVKQRPSVTVVYTPSLADSDLYLVPCMPVAHDIVLAANLSTSFLLCYNHTQNIYLCYLFIICFIHTFAYLQQAVHAKFYRKTKIEKIEVHYHYFLQLSNH